MIGSCLRESSVRWHNWPYAVFAVYVALLTACVPFMSLQTTDDGYVICAEVTPPPKASVYAPAPVVSNAPSPPAVSAPRREVPPWLPSEEYTPAPP